MKEEERTPYFIPFYKEDLEKFMNDLPEGYWKKYLQGFIDTWHREGKW